MKNILLKLAMGTGAILISSCESREGDVTPITREETTTSQFLQINQEQLLIDTLVNNSIDDYWEITTLQRGTTDSADQFSDTRFVFKRSTLTIGLGAEIEDSVEASVFEPGNLNLSARDNFVKPTSFFKSSTNNDLIYPFNVLSAADLAALGETDPENAKYDLITDLLPIPSSSNTDVGYRVLNDISANKVTLTNTIDGEVRTIILEKRTSISAPTVGFLQSDQNLQLIDILVDNSVDEYWEITTLQRGTTDNADQFSGTHFVFRRPNSASGGKIESSITASVFEPGKLNLSRPDNFVTNTTPMKSFANNYLIFPFTVSSAAELAAAGDTDPENAKYDLIADLIPIPSSSNPDFGYRVLDDISANKVTLTHTIDGEVRTIILEKRN